MKAVKRIICLILAAACVFFTGCNSIIYNGNLKFKTYEPETLPPLDVDIEDISSRAQEEQQAEKYEIEGINAFYILPNHEANPDKIIDFKLLDYTTDGRFVYAYLTPYHGAEDQTGLSGAGKSGTAPEKRRYYVWEKEAESNVLVLMSYDPQTRNYQVFYSHVVEKAEAETAVNTAAGEDVGTLSASAENATVMANRLVKTEEYFIFDDQVAYVYDKDGTEVSRTNYSTVIAQEAQRLKKKAVTELRKSMSSSEAEKMAEQSTVTVSDVVMDGYYYVYIPISVELPESENLDLDSDEGGDDEAFENSVYMSIVACYELDIGGEDSDVIFSSWNQNWEAQLECWKTVQENETTEYLLEDGIFKSRLAAEIYMKYFYTMDKIKKGVYGSLPDDFSVFATSGSVLNMELAGVPDLFEFELWKLSGDNQLTGSYSGTLYDLMKAGGWEYRTYLWYWHFFPYNKTANYQKSMFWNTSEESRGQIMSVAKETLALLAQGDRSTMNRIGLSANNGGYCLIPWLRPGVWNEGINENPLRWSAGTAEAVYAYSTSFYKEEKRIGEVNRYCPVDLKGRYKNQWTDPGYSMTVTELTQEGEERTFYYYETVEHTDENGAVTETEQVVRELTETLPVYPLRYRLIFPEGAHVQWIEEVDTGEMVTASGGLGGIYYMELSSGNDGSVSSIRYNDGISDRITDGNVPGKAMDAGILYYVDENGREWETVAFITDEGITFYQNRDGKFDKGAYVTMEQLAQSSASYGLSVLGAETQTASREDDELQVSEEQDEIIRKKTEEGSSSDSYSVSNMSLLNSTKAILSSVSDGLILVNMNNGLSLTLKNGAYYAAFPYKDSRTGGRQFMVVGYDTEEYYYQPGDIARAKCYIMDLEAENGRLESEAMTAYLDSLAGTYLTRTHRLAWSEQKQAYEITGFTEEEKAANARARALFYDSEASMEAELTAVGKELGFADIRDEVFVYAGDLREKLQKQRRCLTEFYRLAGLGVVDGLPSEAWLLEQEGYLITAPYAKTLENILVELKLSDRAVDAMTSGREEYLEYQRQKREAELLIDRGVQTGTDRDWTDGGKIGLDQADEEEVGRDKAAIEQMSFYQKVLDDVREEYESGSREPGWDDYILELLKGISPDCVVNQQEEGIRQLCELAGISDEVTDLDELADQLSQLIRVRELEELIIQYKLTEAAYQSTSYRKEFQEYSEKSFDTEAGKEEAFQNAGFYQVILDLQKKNEKALSGTTWEQKMKDILGVCGRGIVLEAEKEE